MPPALTFTDAPPDTLLRVYLGDHLAGSVAGIAVARRCRRNNRGNEVGRVLGEVIPEIEQDQATLERLMGTLGHEPPRPKLVGAAAAERLGRLKLNGQLFGYSPLSRVVELEGLSAGIAAKENMWRALMAVGDEQGTFHGVDMPHMVERAQSQRGRVEELRVDAARTAFRPTSERAT